MYTLNQEVTAKVFVPGANVALAGMTIAVDVFPKPKPGAPRVDINVEDMSMSMKSQFSGQVFCESQKIVMDFNGSKFELMVESLEHAVIGDNSPISPSNSRKQGQILKSTDVDFKKVTGSASNLVLVGAKGPTRNDSLFKQSFDFEQLGIGGLNAQFGTIFRRAFASRMFPGVYKDVGINHVRGILLYGPPGCGKTLIARQIGKVLNAREPKIVNGPEIMDKYVGGSEEKIRALFADAEKEQAERGDASELHIIIIDEMDSIMKKRGSTGGGAGGAALDGVVNQLLTKIDGVDSLSNILIIGMTNRKDIIDEAILRPGRLEVHIEISLPDEAGRLQILNIHTKKMIESNRIDPDAVARLKDLAAITKNYTGAELEGLVRNAFSYAVARHVDPKDLKGKIDTKAIKIEYKDFERAMSECLPAFGAKESEEIRGFIRNDICNYGSAHEDIWKNLMRLTNQVATSSRTPLLSVLLEGGVSTGKTALAAQLCLQSGFPFVRMISADAMIGMSESQKSEFILRTFVDSYKSPLSIIFIDDIERIIEYTPSGPRFLNSVLQTLLVLIRKVPPIPPKIVGLEIPNPRLMIIGTTSIANLLEDIQLPSAFNMTLHVSQLQTPAEISAVLAMYAPELTVSQRQSISSAITRPIGIKQLLMVLEMAREDGKISQEQLMECLVTVGY